MKKFLIVTMVLFSFSLVFAGGPTDQGVWHVGGSAGYVSMGGDLYEDFDGDGQSMLFITPEVGYFISNNLLLGASLNYQNMSQGDNSMSEFGLGPMFAYFFGSDGMLPFVSAAYTFNSTSGDYEWAEGTDTQLVLALGAVKMIAKNVGISGSVFYTSDSWKHKDADDSTTGSSFGVRIGIQTFIY